MEKERTNINNQVIDTEICFHCGLPARSSFKAEVNGESKNFCCNGCKTACELIYSVGAESYYNTRTCYSEFPINNMDKKLPYESEYFRNKYIELSGEISNISFYSESLHCPSCIWVIEKVFSEINGIEDISINFTTKKIKVSWNERFITLEEIVNTLKKLGYPPTPLEKNSLDRKVSENNKSMLIALAVSAFGMISAMFFAEPFYFDYVQDLDPKFARILQYMSLIVSTPVFFYCIFPFFRGMINSLPRGILTMDSTIFIGATSIYAYSTWGVFANHEPIYFDCLTMFLFLIIVGRYIESVVQQKVFAIVEQSVKNNPKQATVVRDNIESIIEIEEIQTNDILLIKPGEQIPVDGTLLHGETHVNESMITGESKPILKKENDNLLGGSINLEGAFYLKADKVGSETTLNQIIKLVDDIGSKKHPMQTLADKVAHYFIIGVLLTASLVYLLNFRQDPDYALLTAIAVLIVSCPCALGLAMPVAISLAGSIGIKRGIFFKNQESFEKLTKINHIVLDKTGTLTSGKMELKDIIVLSKNFTENKLLEIASAVERFSEHPIAWSIVGEANKRKVEIRKATNIVSFSGKGIKGKLENNFILIGNLHFLEKHKIKFNENDFNNITETVVFIAQDKDLIGYFTFSDNLRENTIETITELKNNKVELSLLSGDKKNVAENIGKQLGLKNIISEVLPHEKSEYIHKLKEKDFNIAMVGDGINDAPAMAEANIGISLCPNNEISNSKADIVILNPDFSALTEAIKISKNTLNVIKQSFGISITYNLLVIPFAAFGYISPLWAAVLMPFSSLIVLLNSLRVVRYK